MLGTSLIRNHYGKFENIGDDLTVLISKPGSFNEHRI